MIPSSASDIAKVMEIAGQLGIATDSLTDFTETMINMDVSTNLSAEDAATRLAKFANIMGMADIDKSGISNWERLGSTIVDLGNKFATTEDDITEMSLRLASSAKQVGLTEAQVVSLVHGYECGWYLCRIWWIYNVQAVEEDAACRQSLAMVLKTMHLWLI